MARYTAEQIYAFAREAGFSPDRAATMTAIAMAESRGNGNAHNPVGENSKGLWQINQNAHPQFAGLNLFDPVQNARAAFQVSHGGDDISPWTTTHKGMAAKYLRFKAEAQAAAESYGDGPDRGMWTGVSGYGDHTSAGDARGGGQGVAPTPSAAGSDNVNVQQATTVDPLTAAQFEVHRGDASGVPLDSDLLAGTAAAVGSQASPAGVTPNQGNTPLVQGVTNAGNAPAQPTDPGATPVPSAPGPGSASGVPLDEELAAMVQGQAAAPQPVVPVGGGSQGIGQQPVAGGDAGKLQTFLNSAVAQTGDRYVFGAETKASDPNPSVFDCSELVEWAAAQAGVKVPDGSWLQYRDLAASGTTMSVEQALKTPGALLFSFSSDPMTGGRPSAAHVAISLGNGKTIEAKGTQYGVGSWEANTKRFQYAGYLPEMGAGIGGVPPAPPPPQPQVDAFTHRVNTDPAVMDRNPSTVAVSQMMTNADPPPEPLQAPVPEPVALNAPAGADNTPDQGPHTEASSLDDVDHDNQDDLMQNIHNWTAPQDHSLPEHHDADYHDNLPGHS
jgi:cell wall-associated NlpC family hydrolase